MNTQYLNALFLLPVGLTPRFRLGWPAATQSPPPPTTFRSVPQCLRPSNGCQVINFFKYIFFYSVNTITPPPREMAWAQWAWAIWISALCALNTTSTSWCSGLIVSVGNHFCLWCIVGGAVSLFVTVCLLVITQTFLLGGRRTGGNFLSIRVTDPVFP